MGEKQVMKETQVPQVIQAIMACAVMAVQQEM
jgi:hypothetical protein